MNPRSGQRVRRRLAAEHPRFDVSALRRFGVSSQSPILELRTELAALCERIGRPIALMEVCGTHTVSIFRNGLRSMLPGNLRLISGPGCPVCVTAQRYIDAAIEIAGRPEVIAATYGDMVRVPGRQGSLETRRADGADVRIMYSIRDALELAVRNPDRTVVFIGVGFETTAPATAAAICEADARGIENFCVLSAHKLVVPAMLALLGGVARSSGGVARSSGAAEGGVAGPCSGAPDLGHGPGTILTDGSGTVPPAPPKLGPHVSINRQAPLDGFLCPGHVSAIIGAQAYRPVVERHGRSCVVAGFEPGQILRGLLHLVRQIEQGQAAVENVYGVAVKEEGNPVALKLLDEVFEVAEAVWRAMGTIPHSGLDLRPKYSRFDALKRFGMTLGEDDDPPGCLCGQVIQGKVTPPECRLFGSTCTPLHPIGPCMVSSEGTCAAWFKYAAVGTPRA